MHAKTFTRSAVYVVAVLALVALALVPAAPAAAIDLGFDVRFTGVIQTVGTETEAWVIGGQTLKTDATTTILKLTEPVAPGLWADVVAKKLEDGSLLARQITVRKEQVRLRGVLMSKPEGNVGDWVISGVTVKVTEDTKTSTRSGEIAVDKWVEAVMTEEGGILTAHQLLGLVEQDAVRVSGEIQEFNADYWIISSIKLMLKPDSAAGAGDGTIVSGAPVVGLIAHAAAEMQEDNTLQAQVLRVAWVDRTAAKTSLHVEGKVTAIDTKNTRIPRLMTVESEEPAATYKVLVLPMTRIHQEKGLLMVGATVHVVGWSLDMENVVATEVTVLTSPEEGGEFAMFQGEIKALPQGGTVGEWLVGDQRVVVNEQTQLMGAAPRVGAWAVGGGIQRADGSILAARLSVFAPRNLGTVTPRPTWTPRP